MAKIQERLRAAVTASNGIDIAPRTIHEAADCLDAMESALRPIAEFAKHFPADGSRGALRPKRGEIYSVHSMIDGAELTAEFTVEAIHAAAAALAKLEASR